MYGNATLFISLRKEKRGLIHYHYSGLKPSWEYKSPGYLFYSPKKGGLVLFYYKQMVYDMIHTEKKDRTVHDIAKNFL